MCITINYSQCTIRANFSILGIFFCEAGAAPGVYPHFEKGNANFYANLFFNALQKFLKFAALTPLPCPSLIKRQKNALTLSRNFWFFLQAEILRLFPNAGDRPGQEQCVNVSMKRAAARGAG